MINRSSKTIFFCLICLGILVWFCYLFLQINKKVELEEPSLTGIFSDITKPEQIVKLANIFYYQEEYQVVLQGIQNIEKQDNINSIIVPHHLVASDIIARQIARASGRSIKQVVIIGPNHENIGGDAISTIKADWETPFGILRYSNCLVDEFLADFQIQSSMEVFKNEHSIGGIAPFVRDMLGDVELLPIVVSSYASYDDMLKLSDWLNEHLSKESLIIYSIDFSHYLSQEEAAKKDRISKELMLDKDVGAAIKLNNDYVDSPFILALSLLRASNSALKIIVDENANSFDYAVVKPVETTSYFGVSFLQ